MCAGSSRRNRWSQILRLIDGDPGVTVIIAHLDREPIYLYPELEDRGWAHDIAPPCMRRLGRALRG